MFPEIVKHDRITVIDYGIEGAVIDNWIPGKTHAVISWRGFNDRGDSNVYRRVVVNQVSALYLLTVIAEFPNLKLIHARIEIDC